MSNIMHLLRDKESVVVFDIDGVLAAYELGEYNHNACYDSEWESYLESHSVYESARPLKVLQDFIYRKGKSHVYACSVGKREKEVQDKKSFVLRNYNIDESHIIFVDSKLKKLDVLDGIRVNDFPYKEERMFVLVDDTIKTLTYVQEHSGYSTAHISSFME